ncbi:MAG TPA: PAS domain S-box protein, partial [Bacteroidota bacterium]|nr:PAS domain S-box protein [Bacteroidota bacterium]
MTILVIEQNEINRNHLRTIFAAEGHRTLEATDGAEALRILKRERVDEIVSGVLLPEIYGYRLTTQVSINEQLKDTRYHFYANNPVSAINEPLSFRRSPDAPIAKYSPKGTFINTLREAAETLADQSAGVRIPRTQPETKSAFDQAIVKKLEERKALLDKTAEELREREADIRMLFGSSAPRIWATDSSGRMIYNSPAIESILEYKPGDLLDRNFFDFLDPSKLTGYLRDFNAHVSTMTGWTGSVLRWKHNNGTYRYLESNAVPLLDVRGELAGFRGSDRDVTRQVEAEQLLLDQGSLIDESMEAIFVQDMQGNIVFFNKTAEKLYGLKSSATPRLTSVKLLCRNNPARFKAIMESLHKDGRWFGEIRQGTTDGAKINVYSRWQMVGGTDGTPAKIIIFVNDITERKKIESEYLRGQRLESIGMIAGGIAHDLNNVLAPILMAVQLLRMRATDAQTKHLIDLLETSTERGSRMVRQVLTFVRGIGGDPIDVIISQLLHDMEGIIKDTFPKSIDVFTNVPDDLWAVSGDPTQLHQVMMNLCVNARDAMASGGKITITARNVVFDQQSLSTHPGSRPGPYVTVMVTDTGSGIPADAIGKIFDPFYSTKESGKGTGIGLSTVKSIVKNHGGFIELTSEV